MGNFTFIGLTKDRVEGRAIICSALDNLTKGASGQAVQNMNLMLGYPETITHSSRWHVFPDGNPIFRAPSPVCVRLSVRFVAWPQSSQTYETSTRPGVKTIGVARTNRIPDLQTGQCGAATTNSGVSSVADGSS